jgi:uncharacterized phiE125 gp8 family phage protein
MYRHAHKVAWNEKLVTGPTVEPISLDEAKDHLRVIDESDDTYISSLISVARSTVEGLTNLAFLTQTWDLYVKHSCGLALIPRGPVQSIDLVEVIDEDGTTTTTIAEGDYIKDLTFEPAFVRVKAGVPFGSTLHVRYTAGNDSAASVPVKAIHAMKLLIGSFYENRLDEYLVATTAQNFRLKLGIDALLNGVGILPLGIKYPDRGGWFC